MNELNLITSEEKFEQKTSSVFKILDIVFICLVLAGIGFSYYSYKNYNLLKSQKDDLNSKISALRAEVTGFQEEELLLRNINLKFTTYSSMLKTKIPYAQIIIEIYNRAQGLNLQIKDIGFSPDTNIISIKVITEPDQFTQFVVNLKSIEYKNAKYPKLFSNSDKNEEVNQATKEYVVYVKFNPAEVK
jgi:hypothetical protein